MKRTIDRESFNSMYYSLLSVLMILAKDSTEILEINNKIYEILEINDKIYEAQYNDMSKMNLLHMMIDMINTKLKEER